jgi:hypothetical protein
MIKYVIMGKNELLFFIKLLLNCANTTKVFSPTV